LDLPRQRLRRSSLRRAGLAWAAGANPAPDTDAAATGSWSDILAARRLLLDLAAIFPRTFIFMQGVSSFPLYTESLGFTPRDFGLLLGINGVLIVTCELTLTGFTRRFAPDRVLMLGYTLLGVGYACTGLAHHFAPPRANVDVWTWAR
jgi:hypothetical protein